MFYIKNEKVFKKLQSFLFWISA